MSTFLTVSEIDTAIQQRMAQQAPDQTQRLAAINNAMQDIYARFDIDTGKRDVVTYLVFDGQPTKMSSLVSDFKRPADLRYLSPNKQTEEFSYIDDDIFTVHAGEGRKINEYSVAYNDGKLYLKALSANDITMKQLHSMGGITLNGTWAADAVNGDATNVAKDEVITLTQNANVSFDVDVSQTANNYAIIENSTMTQVDLSDYVNLGQARFWVKIPSVTNFTSVELRWGSSSSAYWSAAVTTQSDGSALQAGWNYVSINWEDATETGSCDETAIDYVAVVMNYEAGYTDQTGFKVEALKMYLPEPVKLVYWTYYVSQDSSDSFQEEGTTANGDVLLLPRRFKSLLTYGALKYLYPIALGADANLPLQRVERDYDLAIKELDLDIAERPKTPGRKVKIKRMW
jgi:hypothetical protein